MTGHYEYENKRVRSGGQRPIKLVVLSINPNPPKQPAYKRISKISAIRKAFKDGVGPTGADVNLRTFPDQIIWHKDENRVEFRRNFFYTNGYTSRQFEDDLSHDLRTIGIPFTSSNSSEIWKQWPKDSYWLATFKMTDISYLEIPKG